LREAREIRKSSARDLHRPQWQHLLYNRSYKLFDKFNDKSMRSTLSDLINLSVEQLEDTYMLGYVTANLSAHASDCAQRVYPCIGM
jgi:hypothetical protein